MHTDTAGLSTGRLKRYLIDPILILASLYSLYLVVHPYTPLAKASISFLDLTQVQRATHVGFLLLAGYLLSALRPAGRAGTGAFIFGLMALLPLYSFWQLELGFKFNLAATGFWLAAVLPTMWPRSRRWVDCLAAILSLVPFIYQLILFQEIIERAMLPEPWDLVMAFGLTFLLLGQVYRCTGAILPCLVLIFLLYNLHGNLAPGVFSHASFGFDLLLGKLFSETEAGLFGMITGVSMKYLVYFTILGGIIGTLNLGRILANIASLVAGRRPDAPGIVTAISSVFMGMFSGSGAADTQFVSTLSKPMYDRAGYDRHVAAGLAATSGTIAMVTPPVLGSMAFVMVEILSIPYLWVCIMALGPMLAYLMAILSYNYLYAKRNGLQIVGEDEHHGWKYFRRYCHIFLPILVIVAFIYLGYAVNLAVTLAIVCFVVLAFVDHTLRPASPRVLLKGLADGFSSLIPIGVAVVSANLILTLMVMTGLPAKFSQFLTLISGQSLILATFLTAFFSLLLGMGIPPTATYVVSSSLTAPAIMHVAMSNGIPAEAALLATHMFLMYYAILADVTPPVALSAYASASVFGTDPLKTGVYAAKVALPKYIFGFSFILAYQGTSLLLMPVIRTGSMFDAITGFMLRLFMVCVGTVCMSAATIGYSRRMLRSWECWVLGLLSIGLFLPYTWLNLAVIPPCLWFFWNPKSRALPAAVG